jgi:hypothetical protein
MANTRWRNLMFMIRESLPLLSEAASSCRQLQGSNLLSLSNFTGITRSMHWDDIMVTSSFHVTHTQTILQKILFPIGHLLKSEVRQIAREAGLSWVADKKEVISSALKLNW